MKKKSIVTILVLIILSGMAIYFYKQKGGHSTIDKEASDFTIKDTASVDKIFLADKDGKSVLLEKTKKGWMLNNTYPVRPDAIDMLLYTMRMVEVRSPVSKSSFKTVLKILASKSTKVEVYSKGNKIKQYYVGHPTQDHLGTYMLLTNIDDNENYPEPFITHIPGFDGFLSTRYYTDELDWRDRVIMNYKAPQIKQIKLDLHQMKDSSFVIDLISMQRFAIKNGKQQPIAFDEGKLKQYITYFYNLNTEVVLEKGNKLADSLSKFGKPFATLTIYDRNDGQQSCDFFYKKAIDAKNEQYGMLYQYDPDKLFVRYNEGKDYGVAQYYVFGKILQTYQYFLKRD